MMSASTRAVHRSRGFVSAAACALVVLTLPVRATAQDSSIEGRVVDESGRAIPYASVALTGSPRTLRTDAGGRFRVTGLEAGTVTVIVSAQGYRPVEIEVAAEPGGTLLGITLAQDPIALDAITVTGTMKAATVSASPVKVSVVPLAVLQRYSARFS